MVPPPGIEPGSSVLQTGAMTTSAKAALLNLRVVSPCYRHHSPDLTSPDGIRYVTWDSSSVVTMLRRSSDRPGVEPACLLLLSTFEEYCIT